MRKGLILFSLFILLSSAGYILPDSSDAIPYFSRKYNTPCTMCHIQFPVLSPTGMTFKQNGYRLKGEEGEYLWQDKNFPISGKASLKYRMFDRTGDGWSEGGPNEAGTQSLFFLDEIGLISAGTIAPGISYYVGIGSEAEEDISPDVAFVLFNDIVPESRANIKAGKFYNEFFHLSDKRRFTLEPYAAPVSATQYGVELNGEFQAHGVRYALGAANDEMTREKAGQTESDYKNISNYVRAWYGWVTYSLDEITGNPTIGLRGYSSKAGDDLEVEETHTQFDANIHAQFNPVLLTVAYFTQSNVDGVKDSDQVNLLAEAHFIAGPKLILNLRYEFQDMDAFDKEDNRYILNANYYIAPNIGLTGEYVKKNGKESQMDETKLQLGLQLVF